MDSFNKSFWQHVLMVNQWETGKRVVGQQDSPLFFSSMSQNSIFYLLCLCASSPVFIPTFDWCLWHWCFLSLSRWLDREREIINKRRDTSKVHSDSLRGTLIWCFCYLFVDIGVCLCCCCVPGAGAPESGRKTEDDFFLFSQQQGTGGERRKMPKPVSALTS